MPEVEVCCYCAKEIDPAHDRFIVIHVAEKRMPRTIAHVECHQKKMRGEE